MTPRTVAVAIALLVSALIACRRDEPRQRTPSGAALAVPAAPQDTGFAGTAAPVHRGRPIRPGVPPAMLRAVETGSGPRHDRPVFQFPATAGPATPGGSVPPPWAPRGSRGNARRSPPPR